MSFDKLPVNVQQRIIKIYELSIKGVDGEKDTAKRQLSTFLKKYNLTHDDLLEKPKKPYVFKFSSKTHKKLLFQILWSVLGNNWTVFVMGLNTKSITINLNEVDYADVKVKYDVYRRDFNLMLKDFYEAFILANDIYCPDSFVYAKNETLEDKQRSKRIGRMAFGIGKSVLNKRIEKY